MTSPVDSRSSDAESEMLLRLRGTPEIFDAIRRSTSAALSSQNELRARFDEELVRAALSVHAARVRADGLLPDADKLWLTGIGLEQSTALDVARHKAKRFAGQSGSAHSGGQTTQPKVFDLCCGIGVDAAQIAAVTQVIAVDMSPSMCLRTQWNAEIWGRATNLQTQCADVASRDWTGAIVHSDPDRRSGRDRPTKRLEQYHPNLEWMQHLTHSAIGGGIKIGPASNFLQKFPGCEIELISLKGECREATVWFGSLAGESPFRATSLPSGETISADPLSAWSSVSPEALAYVFDPDPATVRSGLLDVMAEKQSLLRLDIEEEYLTGDHIPATAFVSAFEVQALLPNSLRELKRFLRSDPSRHYEIKCRRIPTDANAVRRQLPIGTAAPRVILFARIGGRGAIVVARRIPVA